MNAMVAMRSLNNEKLRRRAPDTGDSQIGMANAPDSMREHLIESLGLIATALQERAAAADASGRLSGESAALLRSNGFWQMRLCRELGGLELSIVDQIEVLAALAAEDASSAWCTMVANSGVAILGATMPDRAIRLLFANGIPSCSIVAAPSGSATAVDGGFMLNGTWRLASAIHHVDWIHATAFVDRDPSRLLPVAIPAADVEVLDTWNVVGLAGTGSNDFRLTKYFLPAELAGSEEHPFRQVRGVRRYDIGYVEHLESYEHLAFAIGIARRALREMRLALARPSAGRNVGDRELVQEQFGRSVLRLQAMEALAYSLYGRIDDAVLGKPLRWTDGERHLPRVLAAQASELALDCVQLAFRRSGLIALQKPNILEKLLRDMSMVATHAVVDDSSFVTFGQHIVESGLSFEVTAAVASSACREG